MQNPPPAPPFEISTRNKRLRLGPIAGIATGGIAPPVELPKTGFLARLWLNVAYVMGGTVNTPNTLGIACAIRRVRVTTNQGTDVVNISGVGYGYLLQNACEIGGVNGRQPQNQFNTAVSAATFNIDMVIPIMLNLHDLVGLIMLQDEQLQILLTIEWETQTVIGGSTATMTSASVTPMLEFFTVPPNPGSYPHLGTIQQIIEDQLPVAATGDYIYNIPRGNAYLQLLLGFVLGVSGTAADSWNRLILRINQGDILYDYTPTQMTQLVGYMYNLTRGLGALYIDLASNDGLGTFGSARDFINSALLTDFQFVLTATATGTIYLIRRMLLPLQPSR
jgi:hypothetical protein